MSDRVNLLFNEVFSTACKDNYTQIPQPSNSIINESSDIALQRIYANNDRNEQEALELSIQTVLYNNRNRIHLFMDTYKCHEFIREMSDEIARRALRFKEISEYSDTEDNRL
ncbi:hypothetical protein D3C73_415570 [compost metagenome]